ncbi:hypothetical protein SAMN06296036_1169 [Pseudobacteriovorax antillogorgiicola]|uniref:Uncharacterized protein n=1 Tax=Pseudobacteriovorax antillogorgiicola TaxID=1513793 RepID=A0A1Y6C8P3_9BACT|nr:hypothetical protein EDD56_116145 [Pseudobacteriovorax antillogorgiicola]SMF51713.1 hypothetical protein SAMN06296036_1169 [Pseudobacteriovorax antillogorgiicola]
MIPFQQLRIGLIFHKEICRKTFVTEKKWRVAIQPWYFHGFVHLLPEGKNLTSGLVDL